MSAVDTVRRGEAVRLAAAYVALFFTAGTYLPYWPVWLAARGLGAEYVGLLLGVGSWARVVVPWLGAWVDRTGRSAIAIGIAGCGVFLCFLGFEQVHGLGGLTAMTVLLGLTYAPLIPLLDGMAVSASAAGRLDYGRVRLWGSASFIAASVAGGALLEGRDASLVLRVLQIAAAGLAIASLWVARGTAPAVARPAARSGGDSVGRTPGLWMFLAATSCLQGAHAVLYGFATEYWQRSGVAESTIGWFWGVGVFAEILLFAVGTRAAARFGSRGLLLVAGFGAIVRWSALGLTVDVATTFAIQVLHAATFGAMHLGAMAWIRENVAPTAIHRATSLYIALAGGVALGVCTPASGWLFEAFEGQAYHAMTALAVIGTALAWRLAAPIRTQQGPGEMSPGPQPPGPDRGSPAPPGSAPSP